MCLNGFGNRDETSLGNTLSDQTLTEWAVRRDSRYRCTAEIRETSRWLWGKHQRRFYTIGSRMCWSRLQVEPPAVWQQWDTGIYFYYMPVCIQICVWGRRRNGEAWRGRFLLWCSDLTHKWFTLDGPLWPLGRQREAIGSVNNNSNT